MKHVTYFLLLGIIVQTIIGLIFHQVELGLKIGQVLALASISTAILTKKER